MVGEFGLRALGIAVVVIFVINLGVVYGMSPQEDAHFEAIIRLLEWRDPISDRELNVPIDRHAPLYKQIIELQLVTTLDLTTNELHELPPEIGLMVRLGRLGISHTSVSVLPPELGNLPHMGTLFIIGTPIESIPPEIDDFLIVDGVTGN